MRLAKIRDKPAGGSSISRCKISRDASATAFWARMSASYGHLRYMGV